MVVQCEKEQPLITRTRLELKLYGAHCVVKFVCFRDITTQELPVLVNR